jgi:transcriptional regulator with XRE-family HTH domain
MEVFRMKPYPALLAELLSEELSSLRQQKALTQEAMAEQLRISSRAYSDLERGRYAASAPTLLFLFSMLDAEAQGALVQQFMDRVQALEGTDAA